MFVTVGTIGCCHLGAPWQLVGGHAPPENLLEFRLSSEGHFGLIFPSVVCIISAII